MPHADLRVPFRAVVPLAALILAAAPAAAQPARTQLSVGARVVQACSFSTDGAAPASSSCPAGAERTVSVERRSADPQPYRTATSVAAQGGESAPTVTWVTITY